MMTLISWYSGWMSGFMVALTQNGPADGDRQARKRRV
jgi:hypothetical protein